MLDTLDTLDMLDMLNTLDMLDILRDASSSVLQTSKEIHLLFMLSVENTKR